MTVQVSAKSLEQKPRYNLEIKILTPGELRSLERSSTSKSHLKAQQPKKKTVQCISFISSKSHSAICNDDRV